MHLRILVLSIVVLSTVAFGQTLVGTAYPDAYQVKIFANIAAGDSYIDITNAGQSTFGGGPGLFSGTTTSTSGTICANLYLFAADEQLMACCSCAITPNESVELDTNTLKGTVEEPQLGVPTMLVALTATKPSGSSSGCSGSAYAGSGGFGTSFPEDVAGFSTLLVPGLVAWGTTEHLNTGVTPSAYQLTETRFEPKPLLDLEATRLNVLCLNIIGNGSGAGLCSGCTVGALAAAHQ